MPVKISQKGVVHHAYQVFEVDVFACPRCGATMRIFIAIDAPDAIRKILARLGLPTSP
jgi:hypothetical protein